MSARQSAPYDAVARKWLALAERRHAHLHELRASGRWKHYFTAAELDTQLREVDLARERLAKIVGLKPPGTLQAPAEKAAVIAPPAAADLVARPKPPFNSAIEAALSAAAELQESAAKSIA